MNKSLQSPIPNPKSQIDVVPRARLELARLSAQAPKTCAATSYAISADFVSNQLTKQMVL
jgi:hypothetical protein